mgnify:CR=1 FL=1
MYEVDERGLDFFAREARAGGRLAHPGIVSVYGTGTDEGVYWISMELVEGGSTLANFVEEMRFDRMGAFKYSREDGTRSARMDDHVMGIIKDELNAIGEEFKDERRSEIVVSAEEIDVEDLMPLVGGHSFSFTSG